MKSFTKTLAVLATGVAFAASAQAGSLSDEAEAAVLEALMDEYHAAAVYAALIDEYGPNTAFSNILAAEKKHSDALIRLLAKHDVAIPTNPWLDGTRALEPLPATLAEAYAAGVVGEITNMALYERELLPAVADYPDVTRVFNNLMAASQTRHLPTFESCAAGDCGGGRAERSAGSQVGSSPKVASSARERAGVGKGAGPNAKRGGKGKGRKAKEQKGKAGGRGKS